MTDLLYQKDSYLKVFDAEVINVDFDSAAMTLNRTAFYPGGGGQPHDTGWLKAGDRSLPVIKIQRKGDAIWHWVDGPPLPVGMPVQGHLDWTRRYQLMRTHTALHILCGIVWRDYKAQVTGGNMEPLYGRMDFEFESMQQELVKEIEEKVNIEIKQGREIKVNLLPRQEALKIPDLIRTKINLLPEGIKVIRTVEIVGLDFQADGGTHVANTNEVGAVRVVDYKSKGKINKRIYIELEV